MAGLHHVIGSEPVTSTGVTDELREHEEAEQISALSVVEVSACCHFDFGRCW
jgi:hypothetical protein